MKVIFWFLQRNANRPVYVQNIYDYISAGMENEDDKNWWKKEFRRVQILITMLNNRLL